MSDQTIRVALLGYDGVQTLDLCGPLDAFSSANAMRRRGYTISVVTLDGKAFSSEAGLRVTPDCALADAGPLDTLILPGKSDDAFRRAFDRRFGLPPTDYRDRFSPITANKQRNDHVEQA